MTSALTFRRNLQKCSGVSGRYSRRNHASQQPCSEVIVTTIAYTSVALIRFRQKPVILPKCRPDMGDVPLYPINTSPRRWGHQERKSADRSDL